MKHRLLLLMSTLFFSHVIVHADAPAAPMCHNDTITPPPSTHTKNPTFQSITLDRAVSQSATYPTIQESHHEQTARTHDASAIRAQLFPQISLSHVSEKTKGSDATHTLTLTGSQLIWSPSGPRAAALQADLATKQAGIAVKQATDAQRHKVIEQFLDTWLLEQKQEALKAEHAYREAALYTVHAQIKHGQQIPLAGQQATCNLQEIIEKQSALTNTINAARQKLSSLAVIPEIAESSVALVYTKQTESHADKPLSWYRAQAESNNNKLQSAKLALAEQKQVTCQQAQLLLPTVRATGSLASDYKNKITPTVGLSVSIPLWDSGKRAAQRSASQTRELVKQSRRSAAEQALMQDITEGYQLLENARSEYALKQKQMLCAQRAYKREQQLLTAGQKTALNLLKKKSELAAAEYASIAAQIACDKREDQLLYLCSYPLSQRFSTPLTHERSLCAKS